MFEHTGAERIARTRGLRCEWRVTQADGQAMPENGPKGLTIKISGPRDKPAIRLVFTNEVIVFSPSGGDRLRLAVYSPPGCAKAGAVLLLKSIGY